jgi:hypothetical protein
LEQSVVWKDDGYYLEAKVNIYMHGGA